MSKLFTVGHSNHDIGAFLDLLKKNKIEVLADVRSSPYSGYLPQYNREPLKNSLKENGINYVFLGKELGARRDEPECYVDGQARYDLVSETKAFQEGLRRIKEGIQTYRVALMCAEKEPLDCHRTVLVCRYAREFADIEHILADGSCEKHSETEKRMMAKFGLAEPDFFNDEEAQLTKAYNLRGLKIAYQEENPSPTQ